MKLSRTQLIIIISSVLVVAVVVITLALVLGNKKTESIATATVTIGSSGFELPTGKKINHTNLQITSLADELNYWYMIDGKESQASLDTSLPSTQLEVPTEWEKVRLESGFEVNFVTVTVTDVFIDGTSIKGKTVNSSASVNLQLDVIVDYYITPDNTVVEPDASQQFTDIMEKEKWVDLVTVVDLDRAISGVEFSDDIDLPAGSVVYLVFDGNIDYFQLGEYFLITNVSDYSSGTSNMEVVLQEGKNLELPGLGTITVT